MKIRLNNLCLISIITISIAPTSIILAQEQLMHQPRVFVSKSGNVFWNKKLPVYLKLSTSPDDTAKTYWVKSKISKYADPFYFDTEGPNMMRTKWAVDKNTGKVIEPKVEVEWAIFNASSLPKVIYKS